MYIKVGELYHVIGNGFVFVSVENSLTSIQEVDEFYNHFIDVVIIGDDVLLLINFFAYF